MSFGNSSDKMAAPRPIPSSFSPHLDSSTTSPLFFPAPPTPRNSKKALLGALDLENKFSFGDSQKQPLYQAQTSFGQQRHQYHSPLSPETSATPRSFTNGNAQQKRFNNFARRPVSVSQDPRNESPRGPDASRRQVRLRSRSFTDSELDRILQLNETFPPSTPSSSGGGGDGSYSNSNSNGENGQRKNVLSVSTSHDSQTRMTPPFLDTISISANDGIITSPTPIMRGSFPPRDNPHSTLPKLHNASTIPFEGKNNTTNSNDSSHGETTEFVVPRLDLSPNSWNGHGHQMHDVMNEFENAKKYKHFKNDCSKITEWLFVSGEVVAKDRAVLETHGITHVVNCAGSVCANHHQQDTSLLYYTLHIADNPSEDIICLLYDLHAFIEDARTQNASSKILLHCQLGVSRSTALCIGYLMLLYDKEYDEVHKLVRTRRAIARPNVGFICQLLSWRKRIVTVTARDKNLANQQHQWSGLYRIASHSAVDRQRLVCRWIEPVTLEALDDRGIYVLTTATCTYLWIGALVLRTTPDNNDNNNSNSSSSCHPVPLGTAAPRVIELMQALQKFEGASKKLIILHAPHTSERCQDATTDFFSRIAFPEAKVDVPVAIQREKLTRYAPQQSSQFLLSQALHDTYGSASLYVQQTSQQQLAIHEGLKPFLVTSQDLSDLYDQYHQAVRIDEDEDDDIEMS